MIVYLAAFETQYNNYAVKIPKDQAVFLSYYYQKQTDFTLSKLKPKGHKGKITIDSGAHSFFELLGISVVSHSLNDKRSKMPNPYDFFEKYLTWVKEKYELFDYFVELDLQELVGQDVVDGWRRRMKKAGVFDKCITVNHSYNSFDDFKKLAKASDSRYIALEGLRKGQPIPDYNKFIKYCYENKVKVHGFALTRGSILDYCPFYSVDSSSWTSSIRFGKIHVWDKPSLAIKTVDSNRAAFFDFNIPLSLHAKNREREISKAKLEFCAKSYIEMQAHYTRLWEKRGIRWPVN